MPAAKLAKLAKDAKRASAKEQWHGRTQPLHLELWQGSGLRVLSGSDLRFARAMLADVARRMGVTSNYASPYKRRLLAAGVIGMRGGDKFDFDLPGFRDYHAERE